jgi:hypothetical protein
LAVPGYEDESTSETDCFLRAADSMLSLPVNGGPKGRRGTGGLVSTSLSAYPMIRALTSRSDRQANCGCEGRLLTMQNSRLHLCNITEQVRVKSGMNTSRIVLPDSSGDERLSLEQLYNTSFRILLGKREQCSGETLK